MPATILSQIICDVEKTLGRVSTNTGYPVNLNPVRPTQTKPSQSEGLCTIEIGNPERTPLEETAAGWIGWHQPVLCTVAVLIPEDNPYPFDEMFSQYIASMEKSLLVDVSRGNLAIDTVPSGTVIEWAAEGLCWIQSTFVIEYRTIYGDPWSQ